MEYKPQLPFTVPMKLLTPTYETVKGVKTKTFPSVADGVLFFGTFKTYGGTEHDVNGVLSIEDTAKIETWFNPDIKSNCRIALAETGEIYEINGEPENLNRRNQFLLFSVKRVKGGV